MTENIIFKIDGGLGKSVVGTAVLKAIRKNYPNAFIVVVTHYTDVFIGNANANIVLNGSQTNGIYEKYLMNKNAKVFVADPYHSSDHITENKHLIETWCDIYGLKYDGEMPEFFISEGEKQYFSQFYKLDKPILVIQPNGGYIEQPLKYSWTRDIPQPVIQEVIEYFKHDYAILHIKREDQLVYPNTFQALDGIRSIAILLSMSAKRLLIDSSSMHIATALNLPSVVTWVGTNPSVFGYEMHKNIQANEPKRNVNLNHSNFSKHQLFEDISNMPYDNLNEVFDAKQLIASLL